MTNDVVTPSSSEAPWPSPIYSWYVVFILMLAYTNSFIDRQILSLLIEPIRDDLNISDTQISLLAGLAFSIFYTLMGLPLARLADQSNRRNIIVAGISVWSLMTAACGAAQNFWHLFLARVGVGIGEATLSPSAFSIISDYFPRDRIARAVAVYSMGVYLGAGLALMIGGLVIQAVSNLPPISLPVIGIIHSWQLTFFSVGLLGIPILLLLLTVREPIRRDSAVRAEKKYSANFSDLKDFLKKNRRTVTWHFLAFSLLGIGIVTYMVWTPTWFIRVFNWEAPRIGLIYGAITLIFGTAGVYTGGYFADWFHHRGRSDGILRATLYSSIITVPFAIATPLMPNPTLALVCLSATTFLLAFPQGLPAAALQVITPNRLRAQVTALYFLVGNLIALGIGPTTVALVTDFGFADSQKLPLSMAIVCACVLPLGATAVWISLKHYRESISRAAT